MDTLVLVLTDVQGSTRLWQDEPVAMDAAMRRHHELVHGAVAEHGGWLPRDQGEGDAVFAAFRSATSAVAAVVQVQRALAAERWTTSAPLRVRIGVHVGEVIERDGNLYGDPVNRCARLRGLGSGGQTLLSAAVHELVRDRLPDRVSVRDLGEHRMKDLVRPERVWQLDVEGLQAGFPALCSLDRALHNLPVQRSPLIGREEQLAQLLEALGSHRLVTLTGFGGMGKTRLALQAAAELADGDADGVWFVDLASVTDPAAVPAAVGRATGLGGSTEQEVLAALSGQRLLLVLDNLEQVLDCASFVGQLLDQVPGVQVLATSREPLHLRGEQELPLGPLALPPLVAATEPAALRLFSAVQLFIERAVEARPDFTVTNDSAPAVAQICQRLEGHPLAIELAAARIRMMSPQALLSRLDSALSVLTGGSRDLPGRQQTLRATIAWSYDLLDEQDRLLLDRMSVFAGPTTLEHLEGVCGDGIDVFTALDSLVAKSLVRVQPDEAGQDRYALLVSIRAFAAERLEAQGLTEQLREQHTQYFTSLAREQAPAADELAFWSHRRRLIEDLDELELAWQRTLATDDPQRISAFPIEYATALRLVGENRDYDVAATIIDADPEPSLRAARAMCELGLLEMETARGIGAERLQRLQALARDLDRCDVHRFLLAISHAVAPVEAVDDTLAALQELAIQPHPPDSPWPADLLDHVVDIAVAFYHLDPVEACKAARRAWDRPGRTAFDVALYGRALRDCGLHEQALEVLGPQLELGVPRAYAMDVHYAVWESAMALLALGRPDEAVATIEPWRAEVVRRGWAFEQLMHDWVRVWALLQKGELESAADLVAERLAEARERVPIHQLLLERTERLAGRLRDLDRLPALIERTRPLRHGIPQAWLSLLLEQALRLDGAELTARLDEIYAHDHGYYLPFGYQEDLEQLLAQEGLSRRHV